MILKPSFNLPGLLVVGAVRLVPLTLSCKCHINSLGLIGVVSNDTFKIILIAKPSMFLGPPLHRGQVSTLPVMVVIIESNKLV